MLSQIDQFVRLWKRSNTSLLWDSQCAECCNACFYFRRGCPVAASTYICSIGENCESPHGSEVGMEVRSLRTVARTLWVHKCAEVRQLSNKSISRCSNPPPCQRKVNVLRSSLYSATFVENQTKKQQLSNFVFDKLSLKAREC